MIRRTSLAACAALLLVAGCTSVKPRPAAPPPATPPPLKLAPAVDLDRFAGRWHVIANIPYTLENGFVQSSVVYQKRADGGIDDFYFARSGSFDAPLKRQSHFVDTVDPGTGNAQWTVHILWPITASMSILYVDPDYRYALIGYPDRSLGWVYARSPDVDNETYRKLLARFADQGYDVQRFRRIMQKPEQLGAPGFQVP